MKCPDCGHELPHNESGCLVHFVGENGIEMCRCETKEIDVYEALLAEAREVIAEAADSKNWIWNNGEYIWNDHYGNEHHIAHIKDIASAFLASEMEIWNDRKR